MPARPLGPVARFGPIGIVALLASVAWGLGGYEPSATLLLELGALALFAWLFVATVRSTSEEERRRNVAIQRSRRASSSDVEIVTPSQNDLSENGERSEGRYRETSYLLGYPFRRHGASLWIALLTSWLLLSLTPLPSAMLSLLSSKASELRDGASALSNASSVLAPTSLAPFLTFQDLLLWLSYVMVFTVTYHMAQSTRAARRTTVLLVVLGAVSGAYGLAQWLSSLGGSAEGLVATGSFGNRNHFAMFQEMLLLVSLGWLGFQWIETPRRARDRVRAQEAKARGVLIALGVTFIALSVVFSLSRSGITAAVLGAASFVYLTEDGTWPSRRGRTARRLLTLALVLLAVALWIGIAPVVERFELVPTELSPGGEGRLDVWRDGVAALRDFWLTGSGASTFAHVFPIYRSFGGRLFYSWAHNDYLQIAIELGLPGLLLVVALMIWFIRRARCVRGELAPLPSLRALHAGYCAAAIAAAIHSFTDFGLHLPANAALLAVVAGLATGLSPVEEPGRRERRRKTLRRSPPEAEA